MSRAFLGEAALTTEGGSAEWGAALSCWPLACTAPGGQGDWPSERNRRGAPVSVYNTQTPPGFWGAKGMTPAPVAISLQLPSHFPEAHSDLTSVILPECFILPS